MKKFITGFVAGALIFSAIPVFGETVKSLVGTKVTGVYTVEQNGEQIAQGAVINGSAYVPVRAIAEATDTDLKVEGRKIILEETTIELPSEANATNTTLSHEDQLEVDRARVTTAIKQAKKDVLSCESSIEYLETKWIPADERALKMAPEASKPGYEERLNKTKQKLADEKAKLPLLQQRVADLEAQLAALK